MRVVQHAQVFELSRVRRADLARLDLQLSLSQASALDQILICSALPSARVVSSNTNGMRRTQWSARLLEHRVAPRRQLMLTLVRGCHRFDHATVAATVAMRLMDACDRRVRSGNWDSRAMGARQDTWWWQARRRTPDLSVIPRGYYSSISYNSEIKKE